jgi:hypothetical protein
MKMERLMRMQSAFDTARTRSREKEIRVRRLLPRAEAQVPIRSLEASPCPVTRLYKRLGMLVDKWLAGENPS